MKGLRNNNITGFRKVGLHNAREPHAVFYLKQRVSFWIATISLFTFMIGNMVGQHGWYAFFASVMGEEDNSAIAYVGTTTPLANVIDYGCWAEFGGDYKVHSFRQAPDACKKALPAYVGSGDSNDETYSMQYMSSYAATTENTGTHAGIDIRVPMGTPTRTVMNGRVVSTGDQPNGYGKYVVIKHPDVPDISDPSKVTTLYSTFAHLSAVYVTAGEAVMLGDIVALSGNSGQTTGPHLHFQMDNANVPYLPYFPSSMEDGYAYTVNAMAYVQKNIAPPTTLVADARDDVVGSDRSETIVPRTYSSASSSSVRRKESPADIIARLQSRREERLRVRIARRESRSVTVALQTGLSTLPVVTHKPETLVQTETSVRSASVGVVSSVEISHDGFYSGRGWEKVRVRLVDADGNVVTNPRLETDITLRVEFGEAEFRPATLSPLDFIEGEATVHVLPRGRRTLIIKAMPFNVLSRPMEYQK